MDHRVESLHISGNKEFALAVIKVVCNDWYDLKIVMS